MLLLFTLITLRLNAAFVRNYDLIQAYSTSTGYDTGKLESDVHQFSIGMYSDNDVELLSTLKQPLIVVLGLVTLYDYCTLWTR